MKGNFIEPATMGKLRRKVRQIDPFDDKLMKMKGNKPTVDEFDRSSWVIFFNKLSVIH